MFELRGESTEIGLNPVDPIVCSVLFSQQPRGFEAWESVSCESQESELGPQFANRIKFNTIDSVGAPSIPPPSQTKLCRHFASMT